MKLQIQNLRYYTIHAAKNKGADQNARISSFSHDEAHLGIIFLIETYVVGIH